MALNISTKHSYGLIIERMTQIMCVYILVKLHIIYASTTLYAIHALYCLPM